MTKPYIPRICLKCSNTCYARLTYGRSYWLCNALDCECLCHQRMSIGRQRAITDFMQKSRELFGEAKRPSGVE